MPPESSTARLSTHRRRLDNGLTVLVREDHSAPVVAIVTHVCAGYFNEPDRIVGISHVLEHMFFKGTERRGVGEIARETKVAGGYLNAGTIYDYTSYYTVLPASSLEQGLDIQADALRNSKIDEEELRRELLVIIQEAKRKLDNPSAVASENLYELMFDVHRMRRWRIGTEEGLQRLTRGDVWDYYRALYRPSNIVLVVVGDVDAVRAFDLVEQHYGSMATGEAAKEMSPPEPQRRGLRVREIAGDITHCYAEWGWKTPGTLHEDSAALDVLAVVLGQGRASRLYGGVRERGLVSAISAYNYTPTDVGVFGVSAEGRAEDALNALSASWVEVDAMLREPPTEAEVQRAKNILDARLLRRQETAEGQATMLAEWQSLGDWRLGEQYHDRILEVTPERLHEVACRYLPLDLAALVVYRPESAVPLGVGADSLQRRLSSASPRSVGLEEPFVPAAGALPAPRLSPSSVESIGPEPVHLYRLDNGVRVAIRPRHSTALVSMGVCFRGGVLHEEAAFAGISALMAQTSIKGTASRSAARLAEETESLGGAISPGVSADLLTWSVGLPARHFRHGLELLSDVVLNAQFPEPELEKERQAALSELERLRDDMYRYPYRLFLQTAFADHPYGFTTATAESGLRRLSQDDLIAWHRREVLEGRPWVVVVGQVDPDAAAGLIGAAFAGFSPGAEARDPGPPAWPGHSLSEVEQRAKAQTAMLIGFPGPTRREPDIYPLQVLANALSGLGGRFFDELREKRSLAYTVSTYPVTRWLAGAFVAYIATSPEKEEEARAAIIDGFARIADEGLWPDELERSKRYTIGAWQIRNQTNGAHLGAIADALLLGNGLQELAELERRIDEVTTADVRNAVRRHFDPDRMVEGIVRGSGGGR